MDEELEEIRGRYIAALRRLAPELDAWWQARVAADGAEAASRRWPTGLAAHPRVIATFRDAYMEIEDLNLDRLEAWDQETPDPLDEDAWGVENPGEGPRLIRHFTALVDDLSEDAPDVHALVRGMVLVPVGLDQDDEVD